MLAVVALACLVFQLRMPARAVPEASYQSVAQVLEAEAQPGDVVLLHPWWTERARIYVPERIPVVGYQGSDQDLLELHPRIWVLSQPKMAGAYKTTNPQVGSTREVDNLQLQLFENRNYRTPRWDARAALASAKVFLESGNGGRSECQAAGRGHRCPNGSEVVTEFHEVKFQPRQCIRFYPPGGDTKVVAEFAGVPAAGSIALRAGMTWDRGWFHMPQLTPVDLGLEIDGNAVGALTIPVGVEGLQRLDGPPVPAGATVKVWARSANPELRELCIELYGLEKAP